jgi:hypothetical protein
MDRLDELLTVAAPLLRRVDEVLETAGAPPGHGLWTELRRVRLLPGDACHGVAALRPAAFADAVPKLRADARACADAAASLPPPGDWSGEAADAYDGLRRRTATNLSGGADSLDERLAATADLAAALTDWMSRTRSELTATLATLLTSDAAVTLTTAAPTTTAATPTTATGTAVTPPPAGDSFLAVTDLPTGPQQLAAANAGQHILRAIADNYDDAMDLLHSSAALTEAVPM